VPLRTRSTLAGSILMLAAGCDDARIALSTGPNPAAVQAVSCIARISSPSVTCGGAPGMGATRDLILGGQNVYVRLTSSNVWAENGTLQFDLTVQNLLPQSLGTAGGGELDPAGVRVFFQDAPSASPSGHAEVANPDGIGAFSASGQPYFQYAQVLPPGATSRPKTWQIAFSPGVEHISFSLYVAARVEHMDEWVQLTPSPRFLLPGDTGRMQALVRDRVGRSRAEPMAWSSSDTSIATVTADGLITARSLGTALITASSKWGSDDAPVVVVTRETAVSMDVEPDSVTLDMGQRVQLTAVARNVRGEPLDYNVWSDGNIWVAVVDESGVVRGTYPGRTSVMAVLHWAQDAAIVTVREGPPVGWTHVTAGSAHSCGLTDAGKPYCWGQNRQGELGIGTHNQYGEDAPVAVLGGPFSGMDAGLGFTCAVATGGAGWCWGLGYHGQLGNGIVGSLDPADAPRPMVGGHQFALIDAGFEHACGVTVQRAAVCWGNNSYGQLGNGQTGVLGEGAPVLVAGGLEWKDVSAGRSVSCGISQADDLYCWGDNGNGQLGLGKGYTGQLVPNPTLVAGGLKWRAIATGDGTTCGVALDGVAYCWGADRFGELGHGIPADSADAPVPVLSTQRFVDIGVGSMHVCATATTGRLYCWGYDEDGQLGRGDKDTDASHPVPEPVLGNTGFVGVVQGGGAHTCALATSARLFCWGRDFDGQAAVQPDHEFCIVPGGTASCHSWPRRVVHPAASGLRTGPEAAIRASPSRENARPGR